MTFYILSESGKQTFVTKAIERIRPSHNPMRLAPAGPERVEEWGSGGGHSAQEDHPGYTLPGYTQEDVRIYLFVKVSRKNILGSK